MAAGASSCLAFLCLCCLMICCVHFPCASSLSFSLDFSKTGDPCGGDLVCSGDVGFGNTTIELTKPSTYSGGVVWYTTAVPLWNAVTGEVASFTTTFSFEIMQIRGSPCGGDGMAFFLTRYTRDSVLRGTYNAGLLRLFPRASAIDWTTPVTGDSRVVAVEFDTVQNEWDGSSQHVGIDVSSIESVSYTNTSSPAVETNSNNLTSGMGMSATVHYDNSSKLLAADLWIGHTLYRVIAAVDLKKELPKEVAVGFSAGTGDCYDLHRVLSWSFTSTLQAEMATPAPMATPPAAATPVPAAVVNSEPEPSTKLLSKVLIPIASVSSAIAIVSLIVCLWRKPGRTGEVNGNADDFEMGVTGPRRYLYHELAAATDNFAEANKLGEGGFGSVYKGRLLSDAHNGGQLLVAIKRFSSSSSQGRKEFEAEVKIISRLSHRNLVRLLGWCDSPKPKGLLLVYELVPQGSLDQHIHSNDRLLTWPDRYKIILGLGSALRYLHLDWEQCVVHGDIKPSNIMLDSSYNAKLGDFGLARLVDHGIGPQTTSIIRGSVGYMDPEFINMRRRSSESDVYSFGIVLLEIVSGRPPAGRREEPDFMLPRWVWGLHSQNVILEAADARLRTTTDDGGGGDGAGERQMERALVVGLWCAHPDPVERPSMAQAMHALQSESEDARLPALSLPQMYRQQQVAPPWFGVGESTASSSSSSGVVRSSSATTSVAASPE